MKEGEQGKNNCNIVIINIRDARICIRVLN